MSQDGSSSRSYIKHPTEKARLDNLAFTSFPEDYLPYTSPSYQKKAPYLVWDDGSSRFRAKRRQCCRSYCCCGTAALASAIALLVVAILAIVAVSVYLGVVTNLFRSPILSMSGRFRVLEGDKFEDPLLNVTSYEFITKADYYKTLVENVILSSSLESAFIAARTYAFRPGSLIVFFRVHLDRRKLEIDDPEIILAAKHLFLEEAIMAPKPSFDNLVLDLTSIDIREYGDEEWLTHESSLLLGNTYSLKQKHNRGTQSTPSKATSYLSSESSSHIITSSSKLVPITTSSSKSTFDVISNTRTSNRPSSPTPQAPTVVRVSTKESGIGYAEWKPVELPDPIKVANLGLQSPQVDKKDKKQSGRGSVTILKESAAPVDKPRLQVVNSPKPSSPSQPSVSSIMSSVSLMIRPNSKNKTVAIKEDTGVGVVRVVDLDKEDTGIPTEDLMKKPTADDSNPSFSPETRRIELASFRLLNLDDHDELSTDIKPLTDSGQFSRKPNLELDYRSQESEPTAVLSDLLARDEIENEPEKADTEISGEGLSSGYFHSTDKFLIETPSPTFEILDGKDHFSQNADTEFPSSGYIELQNTTTLPNKSDQSMPVLRVSLPQLLLNHSFPAEEKFSVSPKAETTTSIIIDTLNSTDLHADFIPTSATESSTESATYNSTLESYKENSFVPSIANLLAAVKATTLYEEYETIDLSTPSFFESDNTALTLQNFTPNHHLMLVDNSPSPTTYQTLGNTEQIIEYVTDKILDVSTHLPHDTTSSASLDIAITEIHQHNHSFEVSSDPANASAISGLDDNTTSSLFPQLSGFRKIVRPYKNSPNFNRNDINDKGNFNDNIFYPMRAGFPSTISSTQATTPSHRDSNFTSVAVDEDNAIHGSSSVPPFLPTTDSSVVTSVRDGVIISCSNGEFLCRSGECIPEDYHCNMRRDCKDNSDEQFCSCSEYLALIGQSQKICDGVEDCWDLSDEAHCPWCSPGQFLCRTPTTKVCIDVSQVCDGVNDCPFGTDERHCVKLAGKTDRNTGSEYRSEGFLLVRKSGQWGKLCLDSLNDVARKESMKWELNDLGSVVCNALTYREVNETTQVLETGSGNQTFFEITSQPVKSSVIFRSSECKSKEVVHVKCQSLECGLRPLAVSSSRRRIVGGQSTGGGSWPWQAALYKEGEFQCGAVIVSDTWLISAGHCFFSTQTAYWTARMGILRRGTELPSPSEQVRRVVRIVLHPDYVDKGFINDIVLLKLERPVMFSDYLRPLCLPLATEDVKLWHSQHCSVIGWGKLYEIGHVFPDSLQEVRLPVISTEECRKRIAFLSMYHITENMFCAGFERGGRDACLGDSGGPLMCQRLDGRWLLLGVTSNGDGCGRPGRPGVYTKVTKYLNWIHSIMSDSTVSNRTADKCIGHRCVLGRCVLPHRMCDGRFDCADGSDETRCAR